VQGTQQLPELIDRHARTRLKALGAAALADQRGGRLGAARQGIVLVKP
jgi:hypothetical protein